MTVEIRTNLDDECDTTEVLVDGNVVFRSGTEVSSWDLANLLRRCGVQDVTENHDFKF